MRRSVLVVAPLLAAIGLGIVLVGHGDGGGPLDGNAGGHGSPVIVGAEYDSFNVTLSNLGKKPIVIDRVRLLDVVGPVSLIGVRARSVPDDGPPAGGGRVGDPGVSTVSYPLAERKTMPVPTSFAASGGPDQLLQVLFRVKMTAAGVGSSLRTRVDYHVGKRRYSETYGFYMVLCAPREMYLSGGARDGDCNPVREGKGRVLG